MSLLKVESKLPQQTTPIRSRFNPAAGLWSAVALSFLLHVLVIVSLESNKNLAVTIGQNQFSALIVAPDTPIKNIKKNTVNEKQVAKTPTKTVQKPVTQKSAIADNEINQQEEKTLQQQKQHSENAVRGNIQTRLSQYLSYPEFARRRGWQGIVVVSLRLNESGNLKDIKINSSSGFDILDNMAVTALNRLNTIEMKSEFKLALNSTLQIPIHFKLKGS